jgi:hypothetical protein
MKSIDLSQTVYKSTGQKTRSKVLKQIALDKKTRRATAIVHQAILEARNEKQERIKSAKARAVMLAEKI